MTLTICMIVRDEAERLPACLDSLPPHDQLVIVDTGSVDNTVSLALSYGAQVEHFTWCDDFAAARNYAESFATGDYIFWIDGDETLIAGHDVVREIVEAGVVPAVRPSCRMPSGQSHLRQELLRQRGYGVWLGSVHEVIDIPTLGTVEARIVYQHHDRLTERAWDQEFRRDGVAALVKTEGITFRVLSNLAREYGTINAYLESAAIAETALTLGGDGHERSTLAIVQGIAYMQLEQFALARAAFIRAVSEDDTWLEPYYHVGLFYALTGDWTSAIPWLWSATLIEPMAGDHPFGESIDWRRYAVLGQCYTNIGKLAEGKHFLDWAIGMGADEEVEKQVADIEKVLTA